MDLWAEDIQLIVSDFDGVMTDNRVFVNEHGEETVCVSRADGQGIHMLRSMGIDLIILSTERNCVVKHRADKLKVVCLQGISDKAVCLRDYCDKKGILLKNVAYIGNDMNDYQAMISAGIKIVPQDACEEVKKIADYITKTCGGYGVIREVAGMIRYRE